MQRPGESHRGGGGVGGPRQPRPGGPPHLRPARQDEIPLHTGQMTHVVTLLQRGNCPQAGLSSNGRWGFSEVKVFTGLYGLAYCTNNDPLNGIEAGNKTEPSVSLHLDCFIMKETSILLFHLSSSTWPMVTSGWCGGCSVWSCVAAR